MTNFKLENAKAEKIELTIIDDVDFGVQFPIENRVFTATVSKEGRRYRKRGFILKKPNEEQIILLKALIQELDELLNESNRSECTEK